MALSVPLPAAAAPASIATTARAARHRRRTRLARPLCRIASVTLDRDDRVAAATVVASGACLDFILSVVPAAAVAGDSPAVITMGRADIQRLHKAAGEAARTGPRRAVGRRVQVALYGLTEGGDD